MSSFDLVIKGGTVVWTSGRQRLDIGVRDGKIECLARSLEAGAEQVIDAGGLYVLPGIIDSHVHPIHAENFTSVSEAAAFGGVTTLMHFIYTKPQLGLVETLQAAREEAESSSLMDFGLHATVSDTQRRLKEIPVAVEMGVSSFKFFTAYQRRGMYTSDTDLFQAMEVIASLNGLVMVHAENGALVDLFEDRCRSTGANGGSDYLSSRPPETEAEAVYRVASLARLARCPLYAVHVSCAEALHLLARVRVQGQFPLFVETCPHYLTLEGEETMARFGTKAKIAPPLRGAEDIAALWAGIAARSVDVVGSDHSAFDPDEKNPESGNLFDAGFGAPGIESMLVMVHEEGVNRGRITLERMVELLAESPARIFGLHNKGRIVPGADADLVLFDPTAEKLLSDSDLHGKAYYSLYSGRKVRGIPRMVIQSGRVVVDGSQLLAKPGYGRFVPARFGKA
ncbi:MAG: dihydroorotase [Chloroflexota bacterium]|jgi:dihydropyrimidinase